MRGLKWFRTSGKSRVRRRMAVTCPKAKNPLRAACGSLGWLKITEECTPGRALPPTQVNEATCSLATRAEHGDCGWDWKMTSTDFVQAADVLLWLREPFSLSGRRVDQSELNFPGAKLITVEHSQLRNPNLTSGQIMKTILFSIFVC